MGFLPKDFNELVIEVSYYMSGTLSTAAVVLMSIFIASANMIIFSGDHYIFFIAVLAIIACLPYISTKSIRSAATKELWVMIITSAFTALLILLGDLTSFFRPCTAGAVAAGMFFGVPAGFTCGFFSVIIASFVSGAGGWTVFQLAALGLIGFMAGLLRRKLIRSNIAVIIISFLSSFIYSCTDLLSAAWDAKKGFILENYPSMFRNSLKWFMIYAVSDVVVLVIFKLKLYKKMVRLKRRFRIFEFARKR